MRRAVVVKEALGPLAPLVPVFTGAGFARPNEVDSVEGLILQVRDLGADLVVVPLDAPVDSLNALELVLREREGLAAIGTAPVADSTAILSAFRRGMAEFLLSPADPGELSDALSRLEPRWARAPRGGHVTAVYSPGGGAGVSTVAVNVAYAIARRRPAGRVVVADLVIGLGDIATHLNLAPTYDLGELIRKLDRADGESLQSIVVNVTEGFDALAGLTDLELGEDVTPQSVQRILGLLRSAYSFSVLDLEHTVSPRTIAALDGADRIVVAFQVSVAGLRKVKRALALFDKLEFSADKVILVANRVGSSDVMTWPDVTKSLGRPVDVRIPNAYQVVADAQTRGVPVAASQGAGGSASSLIEAYDLLAVRLMGQHGIRPAEVENEADANGRSGFGRLFAKLRK
jgi:pilus assembly protein CpaE